MHRLKLVKQYRAFLILDPVIPKLTIRISSKQANAYLGCNSPKTVFITFWDRARVLYIPNVNLGVLVLGVRWGLQEQYICESHGPFLSGDYHISNLRLTQQNLLLMPHLSDLMP